jgi:hypothetical protein
MTTRRSFFSVGLSAGTIALMGASAGLTMAEVPADLLSLVTDAAQALSNDDEMGFLEKFDRDMPSFRDLRERVQGLLAAYEVGSTVEVANDSGDAQSHSFDLDWLLVLNSRNDLSIRGETRRQIVKCRAERRGRRWKITSLEPIDFFRY